MKYKIEKNTVQETLILPLYSRKLCTELYPNLYRDDPCIDEVALVQFQTHLAGDMLLCGSDKGTQSFAQRAEPLAIIHQFAKGDGQLTLFVGGELVQRQSFQHVVGFVQDGAAGGCRFVNDMLHNGSRRKRGPISFFVVS